MLTLLTDFGQRDPYVAEVKAALVRGGVPLARIVDLSHDIDAGDVAGAAWFLDRVWRQWPTGTVHVAVVDPGVGMARPPVAANCAGHVFVAPGNGLLAPLARRADLQVVRLAGSAMQPPPGRRHSTTFHGRDLFAPVGARLAGGERLNSVGMPATVQDLGTLPPAADGRVVWIDRFGNLISDIARASALGQSLAEGAELRVAEMAVHGPVLAFAEAPPDTLIWYWGSHDTLEIALRDASAARRLGARPGLAIQRPSP